MQNLGKRPHLIAQQRSLLKLKSLGGTLHAPLNIAHDFLRFTIQKSRGALGVCRIVLWRNFIDTRGGTTTNLVK
jgi:hypothetical protein